MVVEYIRSRSYHIKLYVSQAVSTCGGGLDERTRQELLPVERATLLALPANHGHQSDVRGIDVQGRGVGHGMLADAAVPGDGLAVAAAGHW